MKATRRSRPSGALPLVIHVASRGASIVASGALFLAFGCASLIGISHDYGSSAEDVGGASGKAGSGGFASSTAGSTAGGATAGGATVGGASGKAGSGGFASSTAGSTAGGATAGGATAGGVSGKAGSGGSAASTAGSTAGRATAGGASGKAGAGGIAASTAGSTAVGAAGECAACSYSIVLSRESTTSLHGASGGTAYQDRCPTNQVVIGYAGTLRDDVYTVNSVAVVQVSSVVAICGTLSVSSANHVTVSSEGGLPQRGANGTAGAWVQMCPTDEVVVGFTGRSGTILDEVAFVCASLKGSTSNCSSAIGTGTTDRLSPAGGDGGTAFTDMCPSGQVARGQSLRSSNWIYQFGLICSTPEFAITCG